MDHTCGAHARAVDVSVVAPAPVLPGDEIVRAVEGDVRRVLRPGRGRDQNPVRIENDTRRAHARAVNVVVVVAVSVVVPDYEVVRAVEGDRGSALAIVRRRDRDPTRVEHVPGWAYPRAVNVPLAAPTITTVVPHDEVVRAVVGDSADELIAVRATASRLCCVDPFRVARGRAIGQVHVLERGLSGDRCACYSRDGPRSDRGRESDDHCDGAGRCERRSPQMKLATHQTPRVSSLNGHDPYF